MALQTSIAGYFNRKRRAVEPVKNKTNKVLILENETDTLTELKNDIPKLKDTVKTILFVDEKVKRLKVKKPVKKEEKDPKQLDIRDVIQKVPKPDSKPQNEEKEVNVPFEVRGLPSPKKGKPKKELEKTPTKDFDLESLKGRLLFSPRLEELKKALTKVSEGHSKLNEITGLKATEKVKRRLNSPPRNRELEQKTITKVCEGHSKLKGLKTPEKVKRRLNSPPRLREFDQIEVEVPASPNKRLMDGLVSSPSKLRHALFKSPVKHASNVLPYVSPRKLLIETQGEPSSFKTPAYQKYYNLAAAGKPTLVLPLKYRALAELFRAVDTAVSIMHNRKETIAFEKLRKAVHQLLKKNITEHHLAQIMKVFPKAFILSREKLRKLGERLSKYDLILKPNLEGNNVDAYFSPSQTMQRNREFFEALLEITKEHHDTFLKSLVPPLEIPKNKLTRWHPEFDIDNCPDIDEADLPPVPEQDKCMTAKEVLIKAKNSFTANLRMERALERISNSKEEKVTPASQAIPGLTNALKGIPKSLLEKVRARQAAKAAELLTRSPEETRRRIDLTRLPETSRILWNLFVLYKKNILKKHVVVEKICSSHKEKLSNDEIERLLKLLAQSVPDWVSIYALEGVEYVMLKKDESFSKVLERLEQLISQNEVEL